MKMIILLTVITCFLGLSGASIHVVKRAVMPQNPPVWDALSMLKGSSNSARALTTVQIQELYAIARPGEDYPTLSVIPPAIYDCSYYHQPGFYADADVGYCQVFRRCDIMGNMTSYLCPNQTLFNQITLVCDWWYNVDCAQSKKFMDYSNSRLYQGPEVHLLDDQDVIHASGAIQSQSAGYGAGYGAAMQSPRYQRRQQQATSYSEGEEAPARQQEFQATTNEAPRQMQQQQQQQEVQSTDEEMPVHRVPPPKPKKKKSASASRRSRPAAPAPASSWDGGSSTAEAQSSAQSLPAPPSVLRRNWA